MALCLIAPGEGVAVPGQVPCPADGRLTGHAALILTPEFCETKLKKGLHGVNHELFAIGKAVCAELPVRLKDVFESLIMEEQAPPTAKVQIILVPQFLENHASQTVFAFANRELNLELQWTAKDESGHVIWQESVHGSGKRAQGNVFNHSIQVKRIVNDAAKDLADESADRMLKAAALRSLGNGACR